MTDSPPESETSRDGPPDWETLDVALSCPGCGYNLFMLTESRCPECGIALHWTALLAEARRPDSERWLFEHCWRRRPVSSLVETLRATVRPWRAWREISLSDRPNPLACLALLLSAIGIDLACVVLSWMLAYLRPPYSMSLARAVNSVWQVAIELVPTRLLPTFLLPAIGLIIAVVTFRATIVRRKILFGHLVRVIVFSWSGVLLLDGAWTLWVSVLGAVGVSGPTLPRLIPWGCLVAFLVYSMSTGFRRYLLLPLAFAASVASILLGIIVALAMMSAYSIWLEGPASELWLRVGESWIPRLDRLLSAFYRIWF